MSKSSSVAWITSFSLHGLLILLAILNWRTTPLLDNSPSISVDIIAENASAIGPRPEISKPAEPAPLKPNVSQDEPAAEPVAPEPIPAPPKTAIKEPVPPKSLPVAKPTPPLSIPQPAPSPLTKQIAPKQTATKPAAPKPSAPAPQKSGETSPLFDLAAATRAASGVNSGGRAQPKLSNARTKSSGSAASGGARLQADLASALRNQVKDCWHEPADLSDPARLIVELQMELAPDGNFIRSRLIRPSSRAGADSTLLIAIDNAQRAARQCAPYELPQARYDDWKSFVFRFDPRELKR